jgi:replicative DNA helicase
VSAFVTEAEADAERAMAAVAMGWPDRASLVELDGRHFHNPRWRAIWLAVREMVAEELPVDPLTVADRLESAGFQGSTRVDVSEALGYLPTADNAEHYAAIVRDGWIRRQVAEAAADALEAAKQGQDGAEVLSTLLRSLAAVHVEGPSETRTIREMLKERFNELSAVATAKGKGEVGVTGIPTGLDGLDRLLGGLQRGVVTVAAARPGMGKSAFALACVRYASSVGIGCHVFSLEDTRDAYCDRVLSGESLVAANRIRQVDLDRGAIGQLQWALEKFPKDRPWIVDDRSGISADEVVRSVRRSLKTNGTQLVVVDYVQLLKGQPRATREESISAAMNALADAAKQDNLAYLVLAQLNRECEKRDDKRPQLADIKQAGTIEERAKCVIALYRPYVYDDKKPQDLIELLIRKNNQGETGPTTARWDGATIRMH